MSCLRIQLTVAWLNLTMPNQTVKNGLKAKKINLNWSFSRKTTNRTFMYLLAPFTLQNFEKNSTLMRMCHFKDQNDPFVMNIFFGTNRYYYFHLPIGPFYCTKLKKNSYRGSRVMTMRNFWAQNGPFVPNVFLENY